MASHDVDWDFKKVVILDMKKNVMLPIAQNFDSGIKLTSKCSI